MLFSWLRNVLIGRSERFFGGECKLRTSPSLPVLSCLLLACLPFLWAQSERGTISGTVLDATGAVVPGAAVVATHTATNVANSTVTTEAGVYTVPSLAVGLYSVRVEKEGFKPSVRSGVTVNAASNVRLDVTLEVGTAQQTIEVTADVQRLQTESAKASITLNNRMVDALPLVVGGTLRSPFDLAALTPEVRLTGDTTFAIGGGQASSYGVTLAGVSQATTRALQTSWVAVNSPSIDAITEFTVDSNGFKAEHGHAAGGVMTFVSKSGTNSFHGNLYEFLRNEKLDARRFFETRRGIYKQHDFGVTAGGPVYIPKIMNGKNKTFFFASYEGFRNRVGAATTSASVPTEEMYNGDFSRWVDQNRRLIPIYDPGTLSADRRTRTQFANNQIPRTRFDPLAVKLIGVYQQSLTLKPNTGAAPGTSEYVRANYLISQGTVVNPRGQVQHQGRPHLFREEPHLGLLRAKPGV